MVRYDNVGGILVISYKTRDVAAFTIAKLEKYGVE